MINKYLEVYFSWIMFQVFVWLIDSFETFVMLNNQMNQNKITADVTKIFINSTEPIENSVT